MMQLIYDDTSTIFPYSLYLYSLALDKKLFTPGPLCTSPTVKSAMLRDLGSRDIEFINLVKNLRRKLVEIAGNLMNNLPAYA